MGSIEIKQPLFLPAERICGGGNDVWSIVNAAAALSPIQPISNLGQGFFGYNPPSFIVDAAKTALDRVDCNQYSPTKGRPRLKEALAKSYSPLFGREINPDTEISVTTGANEGMLCAMLALVGPGEEVIVIEPYFDQFVLMIALVGAVTKYVPLHPPRSGGSQKVSSAEWTLDIKELEKAITPKTKMIIVNSPQNPTGKIFSREELLAIGNLCVHHNILILADEVYDRLNYVPFTRIATLSQEIADRTLTVGSVGKAFYATGWRVGYLIGPANLITHVCTAHTRLCYATPGPQQEAAALGYEEAGIRGFWEQTKTQMKGKMDMFNEIWDELGLPYTDPEGGYFVLVNTSKIQIPDDFVFPPDMADKTRDYKLSYFLIQAVGVASIPPTDFYSKENSHIAADYLRFAICKNDDVLELAKTRLRSLRQFIRAD